MFAPMANPYDSSMNKEEVRKTWDKWTMKRKFMYVLARRFPSLLPYFYRRSFLSGRHGQPEKWLSLSLGKKVCLVSNVAMLKVFAANQLLKYLLWSYISYHLTVSEISFSIGELLSLRVTEISNVAIYLSRINYYWKSQFLGNFGKRMWVNLFVKEMQSHSWRKLCYKYQTGVSVWLIFKCRSGIRVKAFSHGSSQCIVRLRVSGQAFLALYISGRYLSFFLILLLKSSAIVSF